MTTPATVWTVGHSNHELEHLVELLHGERIEFVIDVRSYPYSRYSPQFRLLVGKVLTEQGVALRHILSDGSVHAEPIVPLSPDHAQCSLLGEEEPWRSTQSVSRRRRLSISSPA